MTARKRLRRTLTCPTKFGSSTVTTKSVETCGKLRYLLGSYDTPIVKFFFVVLLLIIWTQSESLLYRIILNSFQLLKTEIHPVAINFYKSTGPVFNLQLKNGPFREYSPVSLLDVGHGVVVSLHTLHHSHHGLGGYSKPINGLKPAATGAFVCWRPNVLSTC